jgi:DNA-binding CsgD family transcriptional regulator/sugar-specific transcriptional regulator TrmB
MLKPLGVDATGELVYRTMVAHRDWGVADLVTSLGLSEEEVRTTLDRLADLALVRPSRENPDALRAVDPEFGLLSLVQMRQAQLQRSQLELAESHAAVSDLIAGLQETAPSLGPDELVGIDEIQRRIEVLASRASKECLSFMPGGAQSEASINAGMPLNQAALSRGVAIRTVYLDSARNDARTQKYVDWLVEHGGEVRTQPTLPARLLLVDRETALVPLDADNTRQGAIQINTPGIVALMRAYFEQLWYTASPFGAGRTRDDEGLTGQERALLSLLSHGMTDEVAARRLGLSLRTVRRMMADLMDRLAAKSRFEAGMRAAQRGWLA